MTNSKAPLSRTAIHISTAFTLGASLTGVLLSLGDMHLNKETESRHKRELAHAVTEAYMAAAVQPPTYSLGIDYSCLTKELADKYKF